MASGRIPVTVITGYLGAGKTTLVNHLLRQEGVGRLAVIVNEFGDVGLDGELIQSGGEELIELSSGCICCVVRGDLIRTLRDLTDGSRALDGIVIETTGLANPSPVIQTFYADQILAARCVLDAVVTVVDALHIAGQLTASEDAADQVALASTVLLNKSSEAADAGALEARLRALNPFAPIHRIDRGRCDPALILGTGGFELARVAAQLDEAPPAHDHGPGGIASVTVQTQDPLNAALLEDWLTQYLSVHGERILRTKGIVWTGDDPQKLVIQAVHMLIEGDFADSWDSPPPHVSRMVFIGRNLDETALRQGILACRAQQTA